MGKIPKIEAKKNIIDKNLKLKINVRAFCTISIFLKLNYSTSKVKSFVIKKSKKRKSQIRIIKKFQKVNCRENKIL